MAPKSPDPPITIKALTSQCMDDTLLQKILALSTAVFEPDTPKDQLPPSSQPSVWEENIRQPGAALFYATSPTDTDQPAGCFFIFPRTMPEIGRELPHIWIACVDPASRGLGIFPRLMERAKAHARELGFGELTVCTYPQRFTKMYRILNQHGWREVCWPKKDVKVLMKLQL